MLKQKNVHIIGICGKGTSGLALMYKKMGYKISGSDSGFYDPVASFLKKNKINFYPEHKKENIPKYVDFVIIGRHAKLVPESNEEVKEAFDRKLKIMSLPEALALLFKEKENTIIAGSFGKSTMTSIISFALYYNKKDPSYFIGAIPLQFKENAYIGKGKDALIEGDEYPSANWDNRSKFLHFNTKNLILISGEHDHINIFPTEESYLKPYKTLIKQMPANGLIVACSSGKNIKKLTKNTKTKVVFYSLSNKEEWHAENIKFSKKTSFTLFNKNKKIIDLETTLLGNANIENIVGASSFILEKKLLSKDELKKAIKQFKGLEGRLDLKSNKTIIPIYESYGSSYAKAKADLNALQKHFPDKKIIAVFEPHTFSWRNENAKIWYKDIFENTDTVIILPPPTHGSKTHNQLSFKEIVSLTKENHKKVYGKKNEKEVLDLIPKITKEDSLYVLITSGSLFGLTKSLPKKLEDLFPKK